MRYIYSLKKKEERNKTNLKNYEDKIKTVLKCLGVEKEGYVAVNDDSFEFSFSGCVLKGHLKYMGKLLVSSGICKHGFIRQKNKAYAFLSYDESRVEDEQVLVEFIDCSMLNLEDIDDNQNDIPKWVNFYSKVELSTSYISVEMAENIFYKHDGHYNEFTKKSNDIFLVELNYRHIKKDKYLKANDILKNEVDKSCINSIKKNTCVIEHLYSSGNYQTDYIDLVDVKLINMVSDSEKESIRAKFEFEIESSIEPDYKRNILDIDKDKKYIFTVYNVGQALATSLREKEKQPFFYFDYGIACRRNKFTLPDDIKLPVAEGATILLSHVHEDHWCGFRINSEVFKCRWIITQKPTKALLKVFSSVYLNGGSIINLYKKDIFNIKITNNWLAFGNEKSRIEPARIPNKFHESGNALYIFAKHKGNKYNIVVSGDQDYDYQDKVYLNNINLLVACHHGGIYSWNTRSIIPTPVDKKNIIIYSYGKDNVYHHPSQVERYQEKGWRTEHHTPENGNYEIELELGK